MDLERCLAIMWRNGYFSYMGPGYRTRHAVDAFLSRYPRGKGIKGHQKSLLELHEAISFYKAQTSRTKKFRRDEFRRLHPELSV